MRRMALALTLAALALGAVTGSAQTVGGLQFTDWTATGGTTATGTLLGNTVTLTGWHLSELPASYLDGSATFFSAPYFTPPLPHGDAIEFRAENGQPHEYTLSFSSPTTDPVLHLASLGTTLQFPSGTNITRVSGKNDGFAVSGSTIIGAGDTAVDSYGNNDSGSTARSRRSPSPPRPATRSTASCSRSAPPCRRPSPPSRRRPHRRPGRAPCRRRRPCPCAPSTSASAESR
jgi:hypothetical protein